jgi:hypothetical protein
MRVPARVHRRRAGHTRVVQRPGDPRHRMARQPLREHPSHDIRGLRGRLKPVRAPCPGGVHLVRVRSRVRQPVPVRGPPAQVAPLPGLRGHGRPHPDAGPGDLPLRRQPQHGHRPLVLLRGVVDPAAGLGHPQLGPVMLDQRRHQRVLAAVKGPLVLPHHDRVPPAVRVGQRGDQRGGPRAAAPRHRPALPGIEELRHDPPVTAHQRIGLRALPGPRGHRILSVLRRHPPVEDETQAPALSSCAPAAPRPFRPRRQPVIPGHDAQALPSQLPGIPLRACRKGHRFTAEYKRSRVHVPLALLFNS